MVYLVGESHWIELDLRLKITQKWKCEEDIQCEYERKSYYVKEIEFTSIMKNSIGKSIFLTREEAEKKLEVMNGK